MSDLIKDPHVSNSHDCQAASLKPIHTSLPTRNATLGGGLTIRRALPQAARRMIGAWCFLDHFGPLNLREGGLNIGPHPHIGLQTFTWTLQGEILHRDSLGSEQIIRPGAVNLMTAGSGISHSEESLPDSILHGVQLWIALPDSGRQQAPVFMHHPAMPVHEQDGVRISILAGELFGLQAPTKVFSPLLGLDLAASKNTEIVLPMNLQYEYGVLVLEGEALIESEVLMPGKLLYLGCGREQLRLALKVSTRLFVIGGEPFEEEILLWWNFVARTRDEIIQATTDWQTGVRFGEVHGYQGQRLEPPVLSTLK